MQTLYLGAAMGVLATIGLDIWALVVRHAFRLPTADWGLVGRWFGHLPRGVFVHAAIARSAPIRHELAIGWIGHYAIGIAYGILYLAVVRGPLASEPSPGSALVFGLVTLVAPWLVLQPGMGAGVFASRTPRPAVARLVSLSMHVVFGLCLYPAWRLL